MLKLKLKTNSVNSAFKDNNAESRGKTVLFGALLGVLVTIGAMALLALAMLIFRIDRIYAPLFATVSVSAGAFVSSCYVGKKLNIKGFLSGLITGFTYFIIILGISLFTDGADFTSNTAFHFVIIILSGAIGGIIGANSK